MPTVREIAEHAGVSKSTVSLVLNNKPGVSEQMRQVVLEATEALRTREASQEPGSLSSPPVAGDVVSIVVLHPPVLRSSYVFSEVLQGIQDAAQNYNVQLRLAANIPQAPAQHVARLYFADPKLYPSGVLLFGAQRHEAILDIIKPLMIPCVVLGRDARQYDVSGIGRDEVKHAYRATRYLLELGHRKIGFVGGIDHYDYVRTRCEGYTRALREYDVQPADVWVQPGAGDDATRSLLDAAPDVTAVLFVNDSFAAEGLPVIAARGLTIPDDLSVISFDDTDIARQHTPPLTSISYNRHREGYWSVKMLMDQIRYPYLESLQTIFTADLIQRESCAPPRQ